MIEGLHIDIGSRELGQHLELRAEHHAAKARAYEQQAASVRELGAGAGNLGQSNDPSSSLAQSAATHAARASFFLFIAGHIVPNETYRLSEADLIRIEIASRHL